MNFSSAFYNNSESDRDRLESLLLRIRYPEYCQLDDHVFVLNSPEFKKYQETHCKSSQRDGVWNEEIHFGEGSGCPPYVFNEDGDLITFFLRGVLIKSLDLSAFKHLKYVDVEGIGLSEIKLHEESLITLNVANNHLTSLDLSKSAKLYSLWVHFNPALRHIDLSRIHNRVGIWCENCSADLTIDLRSASESPSVFSDQKPSVILSENVEVSLYERGFTKISQEREDGGSVHAFFGGMQMEDDNE